MGRRAQGEAGGNRGRDRGRALREEEDDADGWARAGRGGARALRAAARAGARGGPGRVTRGRPGSGLGRESQLGQVKVEANGPRERKEVGWAGWLGLGWVKGLGPLSFLFFSNTLKLN